MKGFNKDAENLRWETLRYCEDDVREFLRRLQHRFMGGFIRVPRQTNRIETWYWFQIRNNYRKLLKQRGLRK